jgi:hypothetical protein
MIIAWAWRVKTKRQQRRLAFTLRQKSGYDERGAGRGQRRKTPCRVEYGDPDMHAVMLLAAAALGIDYGWQPRDEGGLEYLIQIEPELLDALRAGEAIRSDLPPALRHVRSYRITVGRGELPRVGDLAPPADEKTQPITIERHQATAEQPSADAPRYGWSPPVTDHDRVAAPGALGQRYPDFRATEPARVAEPAAVQPPKAFEPDQQNMGMIQPTSGYGVEASRAAEPNANAAPLGSQSPGEQMAPKPWLPLTASLLCLFVSLGGNAYLGLQWWSVRLRCQQLLRDRRFARRSTAPPAEFDEEDQDVRAITEEEMAQPAERKS